MNYETALDLLLKLLNRSATNKSLVNLVASIESADWEELLNLAVQHGLALLLYDRLHSITEPLPLPQPVMEQLHTYYLSAAVKNAVVLHHAGKILRNLHDNGIDVIVLKGLYLVESIYESIGLRTFVDLDIMVRKADIPDSLKIMQNLGYSVSTYFDPTFILPDIKHIPPLFAEKMPIVEIHWGILEEDEPFTIDLDGLWQRAVPVNSAGESVFALSIEDTLLHLCLHFTYQHRLRAGIKFLYDIAYLIDARGHEIDWQKVLEISGSWGANRVMWMAFKLLERITGTQVPQSVIVSLEPDIESSALLDSAQHQILADQTDTGNLTPDMVAFSHAAGVRGKLSMVFKRVFIPRLVIARLYNRDLNSPVTYFYYLVRFYDLYRQYASSAWRLIKGEKSIQTSLHLEQTNLSLRDWMIKK